MSQNLRTFKQRKKLISGTYKSDFSYKRKQFNAIRLILIQKLRILAIKCNGILKLS